MSVKIPNRKQKRKKLTIKAHSSLPKKITKRPKAMLRR
jgi:hypothetical protein